MKKNTVLSAIIGSILEWYDFLLYAYFASVLAPLFFPAKTHFISLLLTYGAFALGFLVRPIGAIIIGGWGDLYGRRKALIFTMVVMTLPTVAIGLLPGYHTIGIAAPILLTLLRCMQGFAVSGEINVASSFLVEHAHVRRRGFSGSLIMAGAFVGILFGAAIVAVFTAFISNEILIAWGWRIPFLLAGIFGIFGLMVRLQAVESPHFSNAKKTGKTVRIPIRILLTQYRLTILRGILITTSTGVGNYFLLTYFNTFLIETCHFSLNHAMIINAISGVFFIFSTLFWGFCSDIVGRKRLFIWACLTMMMIVLPVFWLLDHQTFWYALGGEILFALTLGMSDGLILTLLAELFPTQMRSSGSAVTYNVSLAIFGGTAPLVAISLVELTQYTMSPAIYLIGCSLLSLLGVLFIRETHREALQ